MTILLTFCSCNNKAAGHIRNKILVNDVDAIIAFWDLESPGTKDACTYAIKERKIPVLIFESETVFKPYNDKQNLFERLLNNRDSEPAAIQQGESPSK